MLEQRRALERCRKQYACVALAIVEVDRDDELAPRERLSLRKSSAATVGECVAALAARPAQADAIGVRERQQKAGIGIARTTLSRAIGDSGSADGPQLSRDI